ncbi:hypothetical protein ACZ11_06515 [Lysinibacillus xylanilyticus]|uniref:Uncharacterized protein n=1 Tax=Lysinibacillus xylanilyticus TaxID=582475 RepID=A0A0K9FC84_9BACI|nr:hypothetical protein [Lysinibacillus xylanilyticus]KMY31838.1 hypothetical protein ACZ11_06515 [Lysinibacillus xylanilyticus]
MRKRSDSNNNKAPSRNGNQPDVMSLELSEWIFWIEYPGNTTEKEGQLYREIECKFRGGW